MTRNNSIFADFCTRKKSGTLWRNWRKKRPNLKLLRAVSAPASPARERKRRTRRLILIGSYMEHVTGDDPGKRDSLMKGLDEFLERDRDRELFGLALRNKVSHEWIIPAAQPLFS